jgi:hypothetical protein
MPFELHEAGAEAHRDDVRALSSASLCSCDGHWVGLAHVFPRSRDMMPSLFPFLRSVANAVVETQPAI